MKVKSISVGQLRPVTQISVGDVRVKSHYTVPELMRLTRMTRKQVEQAARNNLLKPTVRDHNARVGQPASFYAATEVLKALIVSELRHARFTPSQIQQVAHNLEERGITLDESQPYLLTNGYSVYFASSKDEVIDILKNQQQMLMLVDVQEQVARLREVA